MSGNAHDRRLARRQSQRIWENSEPRFASGETVKITSDSYGQRYENTKASVISKGQGHGTYTVVSPRRKSPLTCHESHLVKVVLERVA